MAKEEHIVQLKKVLRKIISDVAVIDGLIRIVEGLSQLAVRALEKSSKTQSR